jgi:glycosyltransferase involved in cell wall biosynthesis
MSYDIKAPDDPKDCIELWWGDPQYWEWSDMPVKARVALALSEARSILKEGRERVIANLSKSDLIICPSQAATTAFREAPFDIPIRVVFFGIDPDEFEFVERDWTGKLKFLHVGRTQFRKGSFMVPDAFLDAFKMSDNVQLTIASPDNYPMFERLKDEFGGHPNMEFKAGMVESSMEHYASHHVLVAPHLSEGFGLCPIEAMATGMCCLVSRCSAPMEYFSQEYGYWIEMSERYAPVSDCLPDTHGVWRLPSVESLSKAMRRVYMNRKEIEEKGRLASEYASSELTWEHTAKGIVRNIQEVLSEKDFSDNASSERGAVLASDARKPVAARR